MIDASAHISSICDSTPSLVVRSDNPYLGSSEWGYKPDPSNPKGSCYWLNGNQMDPIWEFQVSKLAEHALGFEPGEMEGNEYLRFNDCEPYKHNYRLASGTEPGANKYFTGRDEHGNIVPDRYNGKTSDFNEEAVSDSVPMSDIEVEKERLFTSPEADAINLKSSAEDIENMPLGEDRDKALADYNAGVDKLSDRIDKERPWLENRTNNIQSNIDSGKYNDNNIEKQRAQGEADWCRTYSNEEFYILIGGRDMDKPGKYENLYNNLCLKYNAYKNGYVKM